MAWGAILLAFWWMFSSFITDCEGKTKQEIANCRNPNEFDKCWCFYYYPESSPKVTIAECKEFYNALQRKRAK